MAPQATEKARFRLANGRGRFPFSLGEKGDARNERPDESGRSRLEPGRTPPQPEALARRGPLDDRLGVDPDQRAIIVRALRLKP
jgi:hypothetical protein